MCGGWGEVCTFVILYSKMLRGHPGYNGKNSKVKMSKLMLSVLV